MLTAFILLLIAIAIALIWFFGLWALAIILIIFGVWGIWMAMNTPLQLQPIPLISFLLGAVIALVKLGMAIA